LIGSHIAKDFCPANFKADFLMRFAQGRRPRVGVGVIYFAARKGDLARMGP